MSSGPKTEVGNMKLGMDTLEESNKARAPTIWPSTINHQHLSKLQDGRSLHKHENFKAPTNSN